MIKVVNESNNELPSYQTKEAAGFDFYSNEEVTIKPFERKLIKTGLYLADTSDLSELIAGKYYISVNPRSGLAYKHGITVLNSPGIIDLDYTGEIKILLINLGTEDYNISVGDRIAQGIIQFSYDIPFYLEKEHEKDKRLNREGFGSTGK